MAFEDREDFHRDWTSMLVLTSPSTKTVDATVLVATSEQKRATTIAETRQLKSNSSSRPRRRDTSLHILNVKLYGD